MTGPWEILETTEYAGWFEGLSAKQQQAVNRRVEYLRSLGPAASRPYVDTISGSRVKNLKELRISAAGVLRVLFAFDPKRRAVLLLGGDKAEGGKWNDWYPAAIAEAEEIFARHLEKMDKEHD